MFSGKRFSWVTLRLVLGKGFIEMKHRDVRRLNALYDFRKPETVPEKNLVKDTIDHDLLLRIIDCQNFIRKCLY